jgi:hypothetical protein
VESSPEQARVQLGRNIRQLKHHWKLGVLLVPLLQLPAAAPLGVEPAAATEAAAGGEQRAEEQLQQQVNAVQNLLAAAAGFGLDDCWQWKPLLDGKQVSGVHGARCYRRSMDVQQMLVNYSSFETVLRFTYGNVHKEMQLINYRKQVLPVQVDFSSFSSRKTFIYA